MNQRKARRVLSTLAVAALLNTAPIAITSPSADTTTTASTPQAAASDIRVNLSADGLQLRVLEAAEIAGVAYDSPSTVTYAGRTFAPVIKLLRDCVRTYRYDDPSTLAIIVVFRGTVLTDIGDLLLDIRGALTSTKNAINPLSNEAENGRIGAGFNTLSYNYLKMYGDDIMHEIALARQAKRRVEIITIGHSLGGISAEIASFWFSKALQLQHPNDKNIVVTNHSFNSPRGADQNFRADYEAEVVAGRLNSISVIRSRDAVSKVNVLASFRGINVAASGKTKGFMASEHSIKLPLRTFLWSINNHSIGLMVDDLVPRSDDKLKLHPIFATLATKYQTNLPLKDSAPVPGACGNGILNTNEQCDDGNTIGGDKCSGTCKLEQFKAGCHECFPSDSSAAQP
jgi:cysteine-rich repeat protein